MDNNEIDQEEQKLKAAEEAKTKAEEEFKKAKEEFKKAEEELETAKDLKAAKELVAKAAKTKAEEAAKTEEVEEAKAKAEEAKTKAEEVEEAKTEEEKAAKKLKAAEEAKTKAEAEFQKAKEELETAKIPEQEKIIEQLKTFDEFFPEGIEDIENLTGENLTGENLESYTFEVFKNEIKTLEELEEKKPENKERLDKLKKAVAYNEFGDSLEKFKEYSDINENSKLSEIEKKIEEELKKDADFSYLEVGDENFDLEKINNLEKEQISDLIKRAEETKFEGEGEGEGEKTKKQKNDQLIAYLKYKQAKKSLETAGLVTDNSTLKAIRNEISQAKEDIKKVKKAIETKKEHIKNLKEAKLTEQDIKEMGVDEAIVNANLDPNDPKHQKIIKSIRTEKKFQDENAKENVKENQKSMTWEEVKDLESFIKYIKSYFNTHLETEDLEERINNLNKLSKKDFFKENTIKDTIKEIKEQRDKDPLELLNEKTKKELEKEGIDTTDLEEIKGKIGYFSKENREFNKRFDAAKKLYKKATDLKGENTKLEEKLDSEAIFKTLIGKDNKEIHLQKNIEGRDKIALEFVGKYLSRTAVDYMVEKGVKENSEIQNALDNLKKAEDDENQEEIKKAEEALAKAGLNAFDSLDIEERKLILSEANENYKKERKYGTHKVGKTYGERASELFDKNMHNVLEDAEKHRKNSKSILECEAGVDQLTDEMLIITKKKQTKKKLTELKKGKTVSRENSVLEQLGTAIDNYNARHGEIEETSKKLKEFKKNLKGHTYESVKEIKEKTYRKKMENLKGSSRIGKDKEEKTLKEKLSVFRADRNLSQMSHVDNFHKKQAEKRKKAQNNKGVSF